jgi:tetratricopeptide (TPR) repeat protein
MKTLPFPWGLCNIGATPQHRMAAVFIRMRKVWNILMVNRRIAGLRYPRLTAMLILWFWVGGCASVGTTPGTSVQKEWRCDEIADAAVQRQEWGLALSRHQALLGKAPSNCLAIYHLGYIQGNLGDRHEETVQYEKAIQCGLDTDDQLYFNLGMAYAETDRMEEALAAFERAVSLNGQNAENFFGLGMVAKWAGQTDRAKTALHQALELDPQHWEARILLTRIYLDEGRLDAAQPHLEYLLGHVPENPEVKALQKIYEDRRITAYE